MKIIPFEVGSMNNLVYIVDFGDFFVVIDTSFGYEKIKEYAGSKKALAFLFTHGHYDHVMDAKRIYLDFNDAVFYMNIKDEFLLPFNDLNIIDVSQKDTLELAGNKISVIHTPGHTPGSVCYLIENHLFTGDTLFCNSCGRVDLPGSDPKQMRISLLKILELPDNTLIHPGHNYGGIEMTLEKAKKENQFLSSADDEELFLSLIL
ncbi:MAG: MBL fold metallo-hydrolase [Elusimicrobiales bacterium]